MSIVVFTIINLGKAAPAGRMFASNKVYFIELAAK